MSARLRIGLAALLALAWHPAPASDAAAPASLTLEAVANGLGAVPAGAGRVTLILRLKGDALRVDFRDARGQGGTLLSDARSGKGWLVPDGDSFALPLARTGFEGLRVDPAAPCARMQARCERAPGDTIAGIAAEGWRYANAGGRGPDGTSRGTFWVDPASGLLLGYRGEVAGRTDRRELRGLSLSRAALADDLFHLSERIPVLDATRRDSTAR